jgi:hypothetical protein
METNATTTTAYSPTARSLAAEAEACWAQADAYRKMSDLAATLGLESEVERMNRNADEYQGEGDDAAERAIDAGWLPE